MSHVRGPSFAWLATLAVLSLLMVGCGSTFPVEQGQPVVAGGDLGTDDGMTIDPTTDGTSSPSAGPTTGAPLAPGAGSGTTAGGSGTGTSSSGSGTTAGQGSGGTGAGTGGSRGGARPVAPGTPGLDADRVLVGVTYTEDSSAANAALGAGGFTTGDQRRNYEVLLEYFNGRGGALGREIVPVYHEHSATSNQPYAVQEQAACATFTQDQPVFVSLAGGLQGISDGTFNACMQAAGVPVLAASALSDQNDSSFQRWPDFVQIPTLSLDAIARIWPAGLAENGYFQPRTTGGGTDIGLLTYDTETMRTTVQRSLKPALADLGQEIAEEAYVRQPDSFADVSDMSAEIQNAVLRFQTQGIQHVLIQDSGNAILTLLFMNSAEGQRYRPRYGLTTNNGGQALVGTVPEAQFADARLVGWLPSLDVAPSSFDESMGPGRALCDAIYADAGITFSDVNAQLVAYGQCDEFRVLIAALEAGSGPLSQETLAAEFVSVGDGFASSLVGPTRFRPDRHYGASRYRLATFTGDCTCFRYTTPWRAAP